MDGSTCLAAQTVVSRLDIVLTFWPPRSKTFQSIDNDKRSKTEGSYRFRTSADRQRAPILMMHGPRTGNAASDD